MRNRSQARLLLLTLSVFLFVAGGPWTPTLAQGQSCDASSPVCDGTCPAGTACVTVGTTGQCTCEAIACGNAAFPECGGECPTGQRCNVDPTGAQGCACGFPPGGVDLSPTSGVFTVELDASLGGELVDARVDGELLLEWQDPQTDPVTGERTVQTEILSMDLSGAHPSLGIVRVRAGRQLNLPASLGEVRAKDPDQDFPAAAIFDVFFEVEVNLDGTTRLLRNPEPLVMIAQIDQIPPRNIGLQNQAPVGLIDNDNPNNPHILRRAFHWMCPPPYPPPGVPCTIPCDLSQFPECFGEDCPAPLICQPDDLTGQCRCDVEPCGNGVLDPGEECDDGNNADGDGCSSDCRIELDCGDAEFPVCDGVCPPPTLCVPDAFGNCRCEVPVCEQGPFPECGGLCPNDGICTPQSVTGDCRCEPPPPCGETFFPECDGLCDNPDEECRQADDTDFCRCQKVEPFCEDIFGDPVCDGGCPPTTNGGSQRCVSQPAGAALDCECRPCATVVPGSNTTILFTSVRHYQWDALPCAERYNVYRAHVQRLVDSNSDGLADDYGACLITNVGLPQSRDSSIPLPGFMNTYLVSGVNENGEGSLGTCTCGIGLGTLPRLNTTPCPEACQNGNDFPTCGGACPSGETCTPDPSGVQRCFCDQDGFPPGGTDLSPTVGHVTVTLSTGETVDLIVHGESFLQFGDPQTDPATGQRTVQTEMLSMDLFGSHPGIGDVNVRAGREFGLPPTLGGVTSITPGSDFPADSFFDVFFEVEVAGVAILRNDEPLVMQAQIDQIPPRSIGLSNAQPVDLTDIDNPDHVDTIQQSFHWMCPPPFPPPGVPCPVPCENSLPGQCLGDCPDANQVCTPDPFGGPCFCDTPPAACEDGPFPECGGECPPGSSCLGNAGNEICRCVPDPVICEDSEFPVCDGDCPTGTHCEPTGTGVNLPSPQLPPEPNPPDCDEVVSQYEGEDLHARYPNGVDFSDPVHKCFRNVATTTDGADEIESFDSTVEGIVDVGAGPVPVVLSGPVVVRTSGRAGQTTGTWQTEMVSMSLSGDVGGIPVEVRESPNQSSSGRTSISDNGDGTFNVDSFFDVFTEISVAGGPFQPQTNPPIRMRLTPTNPGTSDACECVPDVIPCEQGPFPECGGECPPDLTCIQDPGIEACVCGTPLPCEQGPFPECGGECPPDHVCKEQSAAGVDECRCEPEFPGAGFDLSPTVGHVTVDLSTGETVELIVHGESLLQYSGPQTDPATGQRTVQTEMLSMDLSGSHPSIGIVRVRAGREFGLPPTLGDVTPVSPGSDFPADSFFDVFFEVEVEGVATLRNDEPLVMQAQINEIPPRNIGLQNQQPVLLTDILNPTHVDVIQQSFHWMCPPPFPPPGQPCPVPCENSRQDQCLGDCPDANQVCTPDPFGGPCFCDTPSVACEDSDPATCGGDCPPGEQCSSSGGVCQCVPQFCSQSDAPECLGVCPNLRPCEFIPATGECRCGPIPPCEDTPEPQCGGECPANEECVPGANGCACRPLACEESDPATCGGDCPAGLECAVDAAGGACFCQPLPCEQSGPQCGGDCPAPLVCNTDPGSGQCFCGTPLPCDISPFPVCDGACSQFPGTTCQEVAGANSCRCF